MTKQTIIEVSFTTMVVVEEGENPDTVTTRVNQQIKQVQEKLNQIGSWQSTVQTRTQYVKAPTTIIKTKPEFIGMGDETATTKA